MVKCPECGAGADLTKDGSYAHCASCNTIFEPGKEGSQYRGSGSGSGDKNNDEEETSKGAQTTENKADGGKSGAS